MEPARGAGSRCALEAITLTIARGETVVLLGPSGCGKTTLLRIIAGLEQPDRGGRVLFDGEDVTAVPIERRKVGMVFQNYALFPNMNVADNIAYGLRIRGMPREERDARVAELVKLTGIEGLEHRRIDQLSGGQRQRAALRERLRGELNRLLRMLGITTVYVTHDQAEAMVLGDRVVVMRRGAIAQVGTPREIYFSPADQFVAEFVGAANILEGHGTGDALVLPGGRLPLAAGARGGPLVVMIRPEAIRLVAAAGAALAGEVESVSFVGDRLRVTVRGIAARALVVDAPNTAAVKPGDRVGLAVPPEAVRVLADAPP